MKISREGEYLTSTELSKLLNMSQHFVLSHGERYEFAKYRKFEKSRMYLLNCPEVRRLLKSMYGGKGKRGKYFDKEAYERELQ